MSNELDQILISEGQPDFAYKLGQLRGSILHGATFDPTEENKSDVTVAAIDFAKGLSIVFKLDVESACTVNASNCPQVQTCNSTDKAVIEIIRDDNPRAEYEGNCLRVYGKDTDLIRVVNRIMFEWYGIISVDETGQVFRT